MMDLGWYNLNECNLSMPQNCDGTHYKDMCPYPVSIVQLVKILSHSLEIIGSSDI